MGLSVTAIVDSAANHLCPEVAPVSVYTAYGERSGTTPLRLRLRTNIVEDSGKSWSGEGSIFVVSDIDVEARRPNEIRVTVTADEGDQFLKHVRCKLTRDGIVISSNHSANTVSTACVVNR